MEKTVNLEQPYLMDLGREELIQIEGGELTTAATLAVVGCVIGIAVGWKALCDEVHDLSKEIGVALAK